MKVNIGRYPKGDKERKVRVVVEPFDTWSMDHTLALIIHPMLVQLKETKHGAPFVDDEDVPEELRSTSAPPKENEYDTDDNFHKRWNWVLDEMIWAFAQKIDDNAEDQFYSGEHDLRWEEDSESVDPDTGTAYGRIVKGPNDTFVFDKEAHDVWQSRKSNGFKLFGKYYEGLWD
jgi:hypothetical protein